MRVLDLFAGLEGWSEPWRQAGHDVCSVDIDPSFDVDLHADILELQPYDLPWTPDVILASPPCETFSQLSVRHHWTREHTPKTDKAALHYKLVDKTLSLVEQLAPEAWIIENPRAKLRSMPLMQVLPRATVWYCRYGLPFAKPTDLFGYVPGWTPRPECKNGNPDHVAAPRGSKTGIQGTAVRTRRGSLALTDAAQREYYGTSNKNLLAALRAKVPYELSEEIMHDFDNGRR